MKTATEGICKQNSAENICTSERGSNGRMDKIK
jgi:hypothetical protein